MSEISESTKLIADKKSDILKKNALGKSKTKDNDGYLEFVAFLFYIAFAIEWLFVVVDLNMKRDYYGDEMYLVIYGGEESSTKKRMEIN
ncbi:hypothetical protein B9Z55_026734 [Caenorhabditis nigoni]|uniref:Uncharacterized protein n=1 Tax=Caenorhabditis nigoni TaxID=1611254 RepID=A0A2G5SH13_9PELO|nr:hypothetical protein B9Z55_026734 [Caenorhabditis nigoni]